MLIYHLLSYFVSCPLFSRLHEYFIFSVFSMYAEKRQEKIFVFIKAKKFVLKGSAGHQAQTRKSSFHNVLERSLFLSTHSPILNCSLLLFSVGNSSVVVTAAVLDGFQRLETIQISVDEGGMEECGQSTSEERREYFGKV